MSKYIVNQMLFFRNTLKTNLFDIKKYWVVPKKQEKNFMIQALEIIQFWI
jgi:hypothetical protein